MTNNDVLRRLRYILDFSDAKIIAVFALAGRDVKRGHVIAWTLKDDDPAFEPCNDRMLATFLNGLIIDKRGKRDGPTPRPEHRLGNNLILMKLKIAFNLRSDEIITTLSRAGFRLTEAELGSFMRRPGHRNYRACKDQVLRNFLMGLQLQLRGGGGEQAPATSPWKSLSK